MTLEFHPDVQRDVNRILAFYWREGGQSLADRFYAAMVERLTAVAHHPERFSPYLGNAVFRRAIIEKFHHLIIFRIKGDTVRVIVVKHERRHPRHGMSRW